MAPANACESTAALSHVRALSLQSELFVAYTAPKFQRQLERLKATHGSSPSDSTYFSARKALLRSVQQDILPQYGFEATDEGIAHLSVALAKLSADPDFGFLICHGAEGGNATVVQPELVPEQDDTDFDDLPMFKAEPAVERRQPEQIDHVVPAVLSPLPSAAAKPRMRALALHGRGHNANIMKFQTRSLAKLLGTDVEWIYLDGSTAWEAFSVLEHQGFQKRTDFEVALAAGQPFTQWYGHNGKAFPNDEFVDIEQSCEHLENFIRKQEPIDVLVAFAQSSIVTSCLIAKLTQEGKDIPWRLNVFFGEGHAPISFPDFCEPHEWALDRRWLSWRPAGHVAFREPSSVPTIHITSDASKDDVEPNRIVEKIYEDLIVMHHSDGLLFPRTQPRANEIYEQVAHEIRQFACGAWKNHAH